MNILYIWPRSWVCSVWPSVGLGSVRSGPGTESFRYGPGMILGRFRLVQCWPWVWSVWPRVTKVCSTWPISEFGSVLSEPPCPRPKSVWPIPVLGRGLHPGMYVCWPIIRWIYPFHLQDWLGRLPVVWFWIEKWQNRYLVQTGRCLNF